MYIRNIVPLLRIFLVICVISMLLCFRMSVEAQALAQSMTRLHVIANSDSEADQMLKLKVRDTVLECTESLTQNTHDAYHARTAIKEGIEKIEQSAQQAVYDEGYVYKIHAGVYSNYYFDRRDYAGFSLPAGEYPALRVEIGEAKGKNWWCVIFPPLCTSSAVGELDKTALDAGLSESQLKLITLSGDEYELRFWLADMVAKISHRFNFKIN